MMLLLSCFLFLVHVLLSSCSLLKYTTAQNSQSTWEGCGYADGDVARRGSTHCLFSEVDTRCLGVGDDNWLWRWLHNSVTTLKITESYTFDRWIVWAWCINRTALIEIKLGEEGIWRHGVERTSKGDVPAGSASFSIEPFQDVKTSGSRRCWLLSNNH